MGLNFKVNLCKRNTKHNYTGLEEEKKKTCALQCAVIEVNMFSSVG